MIIGVPKEVKEQEYRVALTPSGVYELAREKHTVLVEGGAGAGCSIPDEEFAAAGASILGSSEAVWGDAELVVKVKEPIKTEYSKMRKGQVLFTYLHLAASRTCTEAILASGTTALAYETVTDPDGVLPLLAPMSEVAGRMAPQVAAHHLESESGGRGVLMGGVPGVHPAQIVVLGAGVAGMSAATVASGMQASVVILDSDIKKLRTADYAFHGRVLTVSSNAYEVARAVSNADVVIGAVLVPGARAPRLVTDEMVAGMRPGSVLVDIAIDQGGCFEGSRPTTHSAPTFQVHGSLYYCVANMPGAVPHTSTYALTNATLPYVKAVAERGWRAACREDASLAAGLAAHDGYLVSKPVGEAHGISVVDVGDIL
jgi:alanine dehydrogenase